MYNARKLARCCGLLLILMASNVLAATGNKPNILVVWGDDIGQSNISTYNHGLMVS